MPDVRVEETDAGITVNSDFWEIIHDRRAGGAWTSLRYKNGSGKNLLRGPLSSALRILASDNPRELTPHGYFSESNETAPLLHVEHGENGRLTVVAEGAYRSSDGIAAPVGYRRRVEYGAHGLVWMTLQIMSDCGVGNVVEIRALDLPLRDGLTDGYVRFHPTQAGGADLLGGRAWMDFKRTNNPTPFLSRFTPLQISCFERGVEGIEIFPGSILGEWDCAAKPDIGLGLFRIGNDSNGARIELDPYCMAQRRMKVRIQGSVSMRLGIALPQAKPRASTPARPLQHAFVNSNFPSDDQIEQMAGEGIGLICFKDDHRDGGTFWRNGAVTPYDSGGMSELARVIEACQRNRIKIVPYISSHELHPETHAYEVHAREWMHTAARSLDVIHNWSGKGETGALMCLRSGWLDYRKKTIDAILSALPWDGVCLDWPTLMPCCHAGHAPGPFHSDAEEVLDLLQYCRARVGAEGTLALLASNDSSVLAVNLADHILARTEPKA